MTSQRNDHPKGMHGTVPAGDTGFTVLLPASQAD